MTDVDIAVLGAGPAGAMAALEATRRGRSVALFEAADHVGGMAGSFDVAGVRVDYGSHRLHPVVPPSVMPVLDDLLGDDLQQRVRRGRIALENQWLAFPLEFGDLLRHLPKDLVVKIALDTLLGVFRGQGGPDAASAVRARLGPTVAERFYLPYFIKLWDTDPAELSDEIADRRVAARSGLDVVRKILDRREAEFDYLYPRGGFGQLTEVLVDAAVAAGAQLHLGSRVTSLDLRADGVGVESDAGSFAAGTVMSSVPAALLAGLGRAPETVTAAAGRLRHRAMVLVYLVLDTPRLTEFDAHYFPELRTPVSRMSEPKNFRVSDADPTDHTVLCAEVPCWPDDATFTADPRDLARTVMDTLAPLGFTWPRLIDVEVRRIRHVYPVYAGSYRQDLATLEDWVSAQPRLLSFGRQGLFAPDNSHHAMLMGKDAAGVVGPGGAVDEPAWHALREAYREHVVVD